MIIDRFIKKKSLTVHPRVKCQINGKCQFPARFASVSKFETGFGILVKNRVGWRIYFPEKVSLKISVDFDRGRFRVTCSFSRCGMWIFGFPGVEHPPKTYHVIDSRELIFFEFENDQVHWNFWVFTGICQFSARFRMALPKRIYLRVRT